MFGGIPHNNPAYKFKILDYTYTSQPQINNALPLRFSNFKLVFFIIGVIATAGFLWLLTKWSNKRRAIFLYNVCQLEEATHFLIQEEQNVGVSTVVTKIQKFDIRTRVTCIAFSYHERMYLYHEEKEAFLPIRYEELGVHLDLLRRNMFEPYSTSKRSQMCQYYGPNIINLPINSKFSVFIEEMLTPYQVFQTYTIILWIYEEYYLFSFILLAYALYMYYRTSSEVVTNQQKLSKQSYFQISCKILTNQTDNIGAINMNDEGQVEKISEIGKESVFGDTSLSKGSSSKKSQIMVQQKEPEPHVELVTFTSKKKNSKNSFSLPGDRSRIKTMQINSKQILPGDLLILHEGDTVPCDCIILKGQLLANQRYITGQNYLTRKTELECFTYRKQGQNNFTLYLGTKIAKIKSNKHMNQTYVVAQSLQKSIACNQLTLPNQIVCLVVNTNYNTLRGKYLRAIRYQQKHFSNFTRETIYFIYILMAFTTLVFLSMLNLLRVSQTSWDLFIVYLDLLSTSIPPTLPTLLSLGINFAQHRLKNYNISCILPSNILTGGSIDTIILQGHHALGKQYNVESMVIGTKSGGNFGQTYPSIERFYAHQDQFSEMSSSSLEQMNKKKQQRESQFRFGEMFINAVASCHGLEYYQDNIEGRPIDKKIFEFTKGVVQNQNCYHCQNHQINVDKKIYFKDKEKKLAVVVRLQPKQEEKNKLSASTQERNHPDPKAQHFSLIDQGPISVGPSTVIHKEEQTEEDIEEQTQLNDGHDVNLRKVKSQQAIQHKNDKFQRILFLKGDAQKVLGHCAPDTYPHDSYEYIVDMAEKGFNLICYAYMNVDSDTLQSSNHYLQKIAENKLTFLGFLVMKQIRYQDNILAIQAFKQANIKVLLVSEERQLQTSSIAILNQICDKKQLLLCTMTKSKNKIFCKGHIEWQSTAQDPLTQFVFESSDFTKNSKLSVGSTLYEQLFMKRQSLEHDKIFDKSIVFNRMEYRHERNLYSQLDKRSKISFAVGGGGIVSECASLSMELERDQSSLLSNFHTKSKSLMTIFHCLRICRAGLATNFHGFSMMVLFSLIQFTTVCILYINYQALTDSQTLYQDLFVTFPIFVTLNMTKPSSKLSKQKPLTSFFEAKALVSMLGQLVLQFLAHLAFILYLLSYPEFAQERDNAYTYYIEQGEFKEQTVTVVSTFVLSNYLYLGIVLSTSVSKPFRKPFYTNPWYTLILILLWLYNTLIVLSPSFASDQIRRTGLSDNEQQIVVLAMIFGNLMMVLMYLYENLLAWFWNKYKNWQEEKSNRRNGFNIEMEEKS